MLKYNIIQEYQFGGISKAILKTYLITGGHQMKSFVVTADVKARKKKEKTNH